MTFGIVFVGCILSYLLGFIVGYYIAKMGKGGKR